MSAANDDGMEGGLLALPYQLLIDEIVQLLDLRSLLALRTTCKSVARLVDDELVWRRRMKADYRFPLRSSARIHGWKKLYKGLSHPELYTWGDIGNSRLGVDLQWHNQNGTLVNAIGLANWNVITRVRCMPYPLQISWNKPDLFRCSAEVVDGVQHNFERPPNFDWQRSIPYKLIVPHGRAKQHTLQAGVPVEIHAGGWSFFALTHVGQILAWGASTGRNESSGTEATFTTPTLLDLGARTAKSLTVGREHIVAESSDGREIIEWTKRWDRPAVHSIDTILFKQKAGLLVKQIEAGWDFTAVLTRDHSDERNSMLIWKTEWTYVIQQARWFERATDTGASSNEVDGSWPVDVPTVQLPDLEEPIDRIAAGDNFVIALAKSGTLYAIEIPSARMANATDRSDATLCAEVLQRSMVSNYTQWIKLDSFSSQGIYEAGWNTDRDVNKWDMDNRAHLLEKPVRFTHISAHFKSFAVYAPDAGSSKVGDAGIVVLGQKEDLQRPIVMPELQGIGVIKVSHGDWHSGALTSDGRVLTWGKQSNGALGSWDAIRVPDNAQNLLTTDQTRTLAGPQFRAGGMLAGAFRTLMRRQTLEEDLLSGSDDPSTVQMVKAERQRYLLRRLVDEFDTPQSVRFGFPCCDEQREGRLMTEDDTIETKRVFDIAFAGWHSGALAIDRLLTDG